MAVWPNGSRTRPKLSSLWKQYSGQPAPNHFGLDSYGYKYNCAIDAGVISKIGWNTFGGGGREIYLRLDNGDVILYYHNAIAALVRVGQRVVAGQRLGVQSSSGKTYGIHLHIEVWKGGYRSRRVNPLPYITALVGLAPAGGDTKPFPKRKKKSMSTIYFVTEDDTSTGKRGDHALAGDSPGTQANWLKTRSSSLIGDWVAVHGPVVWITKSTWSNYQRDYQTPLAALSGGTSGFSAPTAAQIAEAVNDDAAERLQN